MNTQPKQTHKRKLAASFIYMLAGHRLPPAGKVVIGDLHCVRCGVRLGLPVTTHTPTMPPVRMPRAGLPPTVAEFESTPEAKAIQGAHARRVTEVTHGNDCLAVSVTVTDRTGEINSDILSNGNPRSIRLARAIGALVADVEKWEAGA